MELLLIGRRPAGHKLELCLPNTAERRCNRRARRIAGAWVGLVIEFGAELVGLDLDIGHLHLRYHKATTHMNCRGRHGPQGVRVDVGVTLVHNKVFLAHVLGKLDIVVLVLLL